MPISKEVVALFVAELKRRSIPIHVDREGGFAIDDPPNTLTIHLDNLSRDYERNPDPEVVSRFVETILKPMATPPWAEVESFIRWQAEPSNMLTTDLFHDKVSDDVALVLVYVSEDETCIGWITESIANDWNKEKGELFTIATHNMGQILNVAKIETTPIVNHDLGMISTETIAFKAALLFHPMLKQKVEPIFGWPVFAVMPCRDFVYIIAEQDQEILSKLAHIVVREFSESPYPLSAEVFQLTDSGNKAIGTFQQAIPEEEHADHDDGMRTVNCCNGQLSFRIPDHWTDEHDEDGQGVFYDEVEELGTLRANVIVASIPDPITPERVEEMARSRADDQPDSKIEELGDGDWLMSYTEDHNDGSMHYWIIMHPVMPNFIHAAIFSFHIPISSSDDGEHEFEILERELRACRFHD